MASQGRVVMSLAVASALLAALVPGVLDTPALATGSTERAPLPVMVSSVTAAASVVEIAPKAPVASEAPRQTVTRAPAIRARVPVGCERLVSPLVRSAAAAQLGRCVT